MASIQELDPAQKIEILKKLIDGKLFIVSTGHDTFHSLLMDAPIHLQILQDLLYEIDDPAITNLQTATREFIRDLIIQYPNAIIFSNISPGEIPISEYSEIESIDTNILKELVGILLKSINLEALTVIKQKIDVTILLELIGELISNENSYNHSDLETVIAKLKQNLELEISEEDIEFVLVNCPGISLSESHQRLVIYTPVLNYINDFLSENK